MGRIYSREIARLPKTIAAAADSDVGKLAQFLREVCHHNTITVGSGGSFSVATFAAMLHEHTFGRTSKALTPLEAAVRPATEETSFVFFSARGANADIVQALRSVSRSRYERIAVVCGTKGSKLADLANSTDRATAFEFETPGGRDGYLATNSLMMACALLVRAYETSIGREAQFPTWLGDSPEWTTSGDSRTELEGVLQRPTIHVVASNWAWPAACDLESKFTEAALGNVLLTDYRNFAHGRHLWLAVRPDTTGMLSLETSQSSRLAQRFLKQLPSDIPIFRIASTEDGARAGLDLLSKVLHATSIAGVLQGRDPGRPSVPKFGRRLYASGFGAETKREVGMDTWVERKARLYGREEIRIRPLVRSQMNHFLGRLERAQFVGVVADYDGTLCATDDRHDSLQEDMSRELNRLLACGIILGIATGRGSSVVEKLRESLQQEYWSRVVVGRYNGAIVHLLDDDPPTASCSYDADLQSIGKGLAPLLQEIGVGVQTRAFQVSCIPKATGIEPRVLRSLVECHVASYPGHKVVESSHSVDVISRSTTKLSVVDAVRQTAGSGGQILAIGDRADDGGNDSELLSWPHALSVNRVSARLDTGYNLALPGELGITATLMYLRALVPRAEGVRFDLCKIQAEDRK